jgi:hypothetical protein
MVPLVVAAGGVAVVAHPWGRRAASSLDADALAELGPELVALPFGGSPPAW